MSAASATWATRLYSSKESAAAGEPSVLAIVEALLASAVLIWLSIHYDTTRWLAIAICLAPLTLLRTEDSVQRGLRWWSGNGNRNTSGIGAFMLLWIGSIVFIWREYGWGWGPGMIPLGMLSPGVGGFALCCFSGHAGQRAPASRGQRRRHAPQLAVHRARHGSRVDPG